MSYSMRQQCIVTGCAGNVGSNLTKILLQTGYRVIGVDNLFSGTRANMADFFSHPGFRFHKESITDTQFIEWLVKESSPLAAIFHLAAIISVPYSMDHADETMRINHEASILLHAKARRFQCRTFVFAGSAAEYGRPLLRPALESDAGDPISPYGLSKYLTSRAVEQSGYGCSLRFFNIYGPTRAKPGPYDGVVRKFLERTQAGLSPVIQGDGLQIRDFLFLGDALRALMTAAGVLGNRPLTGIYNVGTGRGVDINMLAKLTARMANIPHRPEYVAAREGDIRCSVAENSKLSHDAGWVPTTLIKKGLSLTVAGMRKFAAAPEREAAYPYAASVASLQNAPERIEEGAFD